LIIKIAILQKEVEILKRKKQRKKTIENQGETMIQTKEPLPPFLAEPTRLGQEISITGKWIPTKKDGLFRKSTESKEMLKEWEDIHVGAKTHEGMLSTEINHAVGEDALIIHETFKNSDELKFHLSKGTAEKYKKDIDKIAVPECYFFRGPVSWTIRTYSKFLRLPATYSSLGSHFIQAGGSMSDGRS